MVFNINILILSLITKSLNEKCFVIMCNELQSMYKQHSDPTLRSTSTNTLVVKCPDPTWSYGLVVLLPIRKNTRLLLESSIRFIT